MADRYTVSFSIEATNRQGLTLLSEVSRVASSWARARYFGEVPEELAGEWSTGDETLRFRGGTIDSSGHWSLELEHPDRDGDGYRWRTEVRLATLGAGVEVYVDVRLVDAGVALRPEGKDAGRPGIVSDLIAAFPCAYEGHPLYARSSRVSATNAEVFTQNVILHPHRRLPVVVVTPGWQGGYAIDPDSLQSWLAGLATVAVYDEAATWTLTNLLGQPMTCFGGAVRIYWPGCSPDDNPFRHRRWLPEHARELGPRFRRILLNLFVTRFRRLADQSVYDEVTSRIRRSEQDVVFAQLETTGADQEWVQYLSDTVEQAERDRDEWRRRALELEERSNDLERELDQVRKNFQLSGIASAPERNDDQPLQISEVLDAVHLAEGLGSIRFLQSAFESAGESNYEDPSAVYEAFEALDELAKERRKGSLGKSVEQWLYESAGITYAPHESPTTMGKWGNERVFRDGQRTRTIEGHIKFGNDGDPQYCLRIYAEWDPQEAVWVVGHVGRHLTNTQS